MLHQLLSIIMLQFCCTWVNKCDITRWMLMILMIHSNSSDFIGHHLRKDSISAYGACHHAWAPGPHHLNTALGVVFWLCDSPWTECAWRTTLIYMWREQAIIEWSWRAISILACCHSVKLCALAARAFRSQHKQFNPEHFVIHLSTNVRGTLTSSHENPN